MMMDTKDNGRIRIQVPYSLRPGFAVVNLIMQEAQSTVLNLHMNLVAGTIYLVILEDGLPVRFPWTSVLMGWLIFDVVTQPFKLCYYTFTYDMTSCISLICILL